MNRKRPRWRFELPPRLVRCRGCEQLHHAPYCIFCDGQAPLPDKLVHARRRLGWDARDLSLRTGLDLALLVEAEVGRRTLLPEELAAVARACRLPPRVFGVGDVP